VERNFCIKIDLSGVSEFEQERSMRDFHSSALACETRINGKPLLIGVALSALCAGAAPAAAQTYVGNNFSAGTSLLTALQTDGYKDNVGPLVILQEYDPAGPATTGAMFTSAGTVTDVSYYGGFTGGGKYDFTVYALALDSSNAAQNEQTFTVVGEQPFSGTVSYQGVHNLAADFSVGAGDYLAFAGIGPFYPQTPNDAVGSDATYESSSKPNTFTAIPPAAGQTFTVGVHGDANANYDYGPDTTGNQGRSYGFGVYFTPTPNYYLANGSLGQTNVSWSNQGGQSNWVNQADATVSPPTQGGNVNIINRTGANASGPTIVNFDATTDPQPNSLTIDSNAGGQLVELSQSANTLTSGSESIGATGPAEHLQTGGVNNVTGALTVNSHGTYDLQSGATLNSGSIAVQAGGVFAFDGGSATFTSFGDSGSVVAGPTTVLASNCCAQGNQLVAGAAGSYTPATFTQLSGSTNRVGTLSVGNTGFAQGVYNLQGGQLSATNTENIGNGGAAKFIQSGNSTNVIGSGSGSGLLTVSGSAYRTVISGFSTSTPTTYTLQGGSLSTDSSGTEVIGAVHFNGTSIDTTGAGSFQQSGGTNTAGTIAIGNNGTYNLTGGILNAGGVQISGSTNQNGISNSGAFFLSGGTVNLGGIDNSGEVTINGTSANINVLAYYQFGGELILQNGGTLDPNSVNVSGGSFGGDGAIIGDVKVTGGAVQTGAPQGSLHIEGAYTQTGGTITFDIESDGNGGYLESDLLFDPGKSVSITGTKFVFDFLNGVSPLAFFGSGAFNFDAFLKESDGSRFSSDFNLAALLAGDSFGTNMPGFDVTGFSADGAVDLVQGSATPEPSTWALMALGFAGLGFARWRRGRQEAMARPSPTGVEKAAA
jgi:PEP-CTERM motif